VLIIYFRAEGAPVALISLVGCGRLPYGIGEPVYLLKNPKTGITNKALSESTSIRKNIKAWSGWAGHFPALFK